MTASPRARPAPGRRTSRGQERADRTRELLIEEAVACIREEGFAAASARHIVERAGVSWGGIQYHFGDRDGLLTAVINHGFDTLLGSLNNLIDTVHAENDARTRAEMLSAAMWEIFSAPSAMAALEIVIATRAMGGTMDTKRYAGLDAALSRIADLIDDLTPHADSIATLLWAAPVGMMIARMMRPQSQWPKSGQDALTDLIANHISVRAPLASNGWVPSADGPREPDPS
jgi:AcrR family transcriptional regulator